MGKGLSLDLSRRDRQRLAELLRGGVQPMRTVLRALALRQMYEGGTTPVVGASLGLSAKAVWEIGKRYREGGLDRALFESARPGKAPALDEQQRQRIIAVACSVPPAGRARWTVRLLTEEAMKRKLVPRVGRETIRVLMESHDLKPWREKMWCVPKLDKECTKRPALPFPCGLDRWPDAITSTSDAEPPTCFAVWNPGRNGTSPG